MKQTLILLFFLLVDIINVYAGKRITIKGVQYETLIDNTASARLTVIARGNVEILESVQFGKHSYRVVSIEEAYFNQNKGITSVTIPQTVKAIKVGAFRGCENLQKLTFQSSLYIIEKDAFAGCNNITNIEGNTVPFMEYKNKGGKNVSTHDKKHLTPYFSIYAESKLKERMEFWQTKKAYETAEQYRTRVTDANRRKRMDEYVEEQKKEFVSMYSPSNVSTILGNYDSDYGIYIIQTDYYGKLFAQVPKSDAVHFRQNYSKVEVIPQFGVVGDTLAIISSQFKLGDKVYESAANYAGNGGDDYQFDLPPLDMNLALNGQKSQPTVAVDNTLDKDIPKTKQENAKTFAFIIGNENYQKASPVPYAKNDARIFAEYCKLTLGMPDKNVKVYNDVTYGALIGVISDIQKIAKAFKGDINVILYYAGHGIPDEATGDGYLLPVDADGMRMEACYPLSRLYKELGSLQTLSVTTFLDACFSGAQRGDGMVLAARSVAIKTKEEHPLGNTVVFTAATDKQTAYPYEEKGHGLFTYYLLKKLHDTKGNCTLGELGAYVCDEVAKQAVLSNGKEQTPTVLTSSGMADSWQDKKLK